MPCEPRARLVWHWRESWGSIGDGIVGAANFHIRPGKGPIETPWSRLRTPTQDVLVETVARRPERRFPGSSLDRQLHTLRVRLAQGSLGL